MNRTLKIVLIVAAVATFGWYFRKAYYGNKARNAAIDSGMNNGIKWNVFQYLFVMFHSWINGQPQPAIYQQGPNRIPVAELTASPRAKVIELDIPFLKKSW